MPNTIGMEAEKLRGKDVGFNFDGAKTQTKDFCPTSIFLNNSIKSTGYEVHLDWKAVGFTCCFF